MKVKGKSLNELIFVTYLWLFVLLKPILLAFSNISFYILLGTTILLLFYSLTFNYRKKDFVSIKFIYFAIIIEIIFIGNTFFFKNELSFTINYNIVLYCIITVYLFSKVEDFNVVLKYYSFFSIIAFVLFSFDPFNDYGIFSSYMGFGYSLILPCYLGLYIIRKRFHIKYFILLEIFCVFEAIIYSNRGVIISIIIFNLIYELFVNKNSFKKFIKIVTASTIALIVFLNLKLIVDYLYSYLIARNQSSYSLLSIKGYLDNKNVSNLLSGRDVIWENSIYTFNKNPILGNGIGYFESKFNTYTHNIFLDILISFGLLGFIILSITLAISFYKIIKTQDPSQKLFLMMAFILSFPKLLLSTTYYSEFYIWIILFYTLISQTEKNKILPNKKVEVKNV